MTHQPIELAAPDSPEWLTSRKMGIGASESGAVLGLDKYKTPLDVYCEKRGIGERFAGNKFTERGKKVEPLIVEEFAALTGSPIMRYPCPMFASSRVPFILATPDAQLTETEGVDCKWMTSRGEAALGDDGTDAVPAHWIAQAQQQMYVMEWVTVYFCVWVEAETRIFTVHRNDKFIDLLVKAEQELWQRIQDGNPPAPDFNHEHTPELVKNLYGITKGKTVELAEEVAQLWKQRQEASRVESEAKKRKERLTAEVLHAMGDAEVGKIPGYEFEIARGWTEPTQVEAYTRKGFFRVTERKVKP